VDRNKTDIKPTSLLHTAPLVQSSKVTKPNVIPGDLPMLELTDVTRRFGSNVAVDAVSLSIPEGQMVGVIGRSGAGKSTLLRMINRLIAVKQRRDPVQRQRRFRRLTGGELRNWHRDCAMIFQQFNLVPRLDVLTNVLLGRLNHRSTLLNILTCLYRRRARERSCRIGTARISPRQRCRWQVRCREASSSASPLPGP
jgi:ABC-type sugar transport system ATPase subunit